ncbi:MAG TPA: ZIP family metal transporter [Bacillota bacterium]|nr:ZIP family metal transporter [Bacillota bacterium]
MQTMLTISLVSGLATGMGGFIVTLWRKPRETYLTALLGFAAGVMLAVIIFDLLPAALIFGGFWPVSLGFITGCLVLWSLDYLITLLSPASPGGRSALVYFRKLGYLIAMGIALHDLPEGMAIAVGYESSQKLGLTIALSIALHNVPEGIAIATPLKMGGLGTPSITAVLTVLAMFTPLGSFLGLLLLTDSPQYLSYFLAFAAGAMSYIVKSELLPSLRRSGGTGTFLSLAAGFGLLMMITLGNSGN